MHCVANMTEGIPTQAQLEMNIIVNFIITTVALFGNTSVIVMFLLSKKLQNMNNASVTLLSISDIIRAYLMVPKIHHQLYLLKDGDVAPIKEPLCSVTAVLYSCTIMYSPMFLALIAIIRYYKFKPNNFGISVITIRRYIVLVLFIIILGAIISFFPFFGFGNFRFSRSHGTCFVDWCDDNRVYRIFFYSVCFGIVFPILCCCYGALIRSINRQGRNMLAFRNDSMTQTELKNEKPKQVTLTSHKSFPAVEGTVIINRNVNKDVTIDERNIDAKKEKEIRKPNRSISMLSSTSSQMEVQVYLREKRVTRVLMTIFATYIFCWIPASILNVIALTDKVHIAPIWFYLIVTLVDLKSAIDPLLYGFGNPSYWKVFRRFLRSVFRSRRKSYTLQ